MLALQENGKEAEAAIDVLSDALRVAPLIRSEHQVFAHGKRREDLPALRDVADAQSYDLMGRHAVEFRAPPPVLLPLPPGEGRGEGKLRETWIAVRITSLR